LFAFSAEHVIVNPDNQLSCSGSSR